MFEIEQLSQEQVSRFPEFVEKWKKIGLSTDRVLKHDYIPICNRIMSFLNRNKNPIVISMPSPVSAWIATNYLAYFDAKNLSRVLNFSEDDVDLQVYSQVEAYVFSQVDSQADSQVWSQLESYVWDQVYSQVDSQVLSKVEAPVSSRVYLQVYSQVLSQVESNAKWEVNSYVWSQVGSQVGSRVNLEIKKFLYPYFCGNFYSGTCSFYDFLENACSLELPDWSIIKEQTKLCVIYPLENYIIFSQKPTELHFKGNLLHRDGGPSWAFEDGFCGWSLNGVRVSRELAETPAEALDPRILINAENAEVRREIVRKIGIERVALKLGAKTIDKLGDYELLLLDLEDGRQRPYLKMRNPSINTWHLEGVPPEIKTVEQALNWRNDDAEATEVLT